MLAELKLRFTPAPLRRRKLQRRADRAAKAIALMTERAIRANPREVDELLANPQLHEQFRLLATLDEPELIAFLEVLESGMPADIRRLLRELNNGT